jgi:DNA replication and repair protein RecF
VAKIRGQRQIQIADFGLWILPKKGFFTGGIRAFSFLSCGFMLRLRSITLTQFKNYSHQQFSFDRNIIAITGLNGIGKTNLLDAIHYLCFTKSYFTPADGTNVQQGKTGFRIEGQLTLNSQPVNLTIVLRENGKKEVSCNGTAYEKFSQHVGHYPCVMIAPDDSELITGGSELRRRFLDTLLSQINSGYLQHLIEYNKIMQQRNSYLKSCSQTQSRNTALLDVLDEQLLNAGNFIFDVRNKFLPQLRQCILEFYKTIAGKHEPIGVNYESQLHEKSFSELLIQCREKDYLLQRCTAGIHKDDLLFLLNGDTFKTKASQGQRKSLLFSLKLAEGEIIKKHKGFAPLFLLDDVFEKLDAFRMQNLLHSICTNSGAQVFITDTHQERIEQSFRDAGLSFQLIQL